MLHSNAEHEIQLQRDYAFSTTAEKYIRFTKGILIWAAPRCPCARVA